MTYTLVSDGSSDRALMPILSWSVRRQGFAGTISPQWADLGRLRNPPSDLRRRIQASLELYPCDLLFVHRDAENRPVEQRAAELASAVEGLQFPVARVIPVRMMEAWLLTNEDAIRSAAGNPNGSDPLAVPLIQELENLVDPKETLHSLIGQASGLNWRRRRRLNVRRALHRIAELTDDFALLDQLPAFVRFSNDLRQILIDHQFVQ